MNAPAAAENASALVSLSALHKGARGTVATVCDDGAALGDETGGTVVMRLIELGFVPGEAFEIVGESLSPLARFAGLFGTRRLGDPMAVRIGGSCFALRRREAAAVMVKLGAP